MTEDHEYYDWADTDDLLSHMRKQHSLSPLRLEELGAAYSDGGGGYRARHRAAHGLTGMDKVTGLIREHAGTMYRKTLTCAQDVADAVASVSVPAKPRQPWEPDIASLTGIDVTVIPGYGPGRWKMTRHDHCDVIGGDGIDQAMIVTHKDCTVLGEGVLELCSRCDAIATCRTGGLCPACGDVPMCQPCYDLHAKEIKDGLV